MNFKDVYGELKRRNVFKAALAYLVVSWIILQVISIVFPMLNIPGFISKSILVILILGFPLWVIFAWIYEVTPEGLRKTKKVSRHHSITAETSNKFNKIILGALAIAIVLLGANLYSNYSTTTSEEINPGSSITKISTNSLESEEKSIAVLAFADMSPDKDQEYFSDGISEEILNYLAKNPELKVISRTSSFSFKGENTDIREIGQKLNARYILEGSVRKADSTFRITAQLIHVDDGAHLWSETYDRKMDDIFKIQDEIAEAVTRNLEASLLGIKIASVDPEAYNNYLQAKSLRNQFTLEAIKKADDLIDKAIEIDSNYAPSWYIKAKITANLFELEYKAANKDHIEKIVHFLNTAIDLDPKYPEPYVFLAEIENFKGNVEVSKSLMRKALDLDRNNSYAWRALAMDPTVPLDQRFEFMKKAMISDPLNFVNHFYLTWLHFEAGNYEEALEALNINISHYPNAVQSYVFKAELLGLQGKYEEAFVALEKETDKRQKLYGRTILLIKQGKEQEGLIAIKKFADEYSENPPFYAMAQFYALLNEPQMAYEWLDKTLENSPGSIVNIRWDPYLDNLRGSARFKTFVKKANLPEIKPVNIQVD